MSMQKLTIQLVQQKTSIVDQINAIFKAQTKWLLQLYQTSVTNLQQSTTPAEKTIHSHDIKVINSMLITLIADKNKYINYLDVVYNDYFCHAFTNVETIKQFFNIVFTNSIVDFDSHHNVIQNNNNMNININQDINVTPEYTYQQQNLEPVEWYPNFNIQNINPNINLNVNANMNMNAIASTNTNDSVNADIYTTITIKSQPITDLDYNGNYNYNNNTNNNNDNDNYNDNYNYDDNYNNININGGGVGEISNIGSIGYDGNNGNNGNIGNFGNFANVGNIGNIHGQPKAELLDNNINNPIEIKQESDPHKYYAYQHLFRYNRQYNEYTCKICENYHVTFIGSVVKHIRNKHTRAAKRAKLNFMLKKRQSVEPKYFDFVLISKNYQKLQIKGYWRCKHKITCNKRGNNGNKSSNNSRICGQVLTSKASALNHALIHKGIKPWQCNLCNNRFSSKANLNQHILIHTGEKPHQCHICHKRFRGKGTLRDHLITHTGEKPHRCHFKGCNKAYGRRRGLTRHFLSHFKEKTFVCKIAGCGKAYQSQSGLKHHMNKHYRKDELKCDLCGKILHSGKSALAAHKRNVHRMFVGEEFECDICHSKTATKWGLKIHKAQVHGVHTYVDSKEMTGGFE